MRGKLLGMCMPMTSRRKKKKIGTTQIGCQIGCSPTRCLDQFAIISAPVLVAYPQNTSPLILKPRHG